MARAAPFITMGCAASTPSTPLPPASRALVEFCWHYFATEGGGVGPGAAAGAGGGGGGGASGGGGGALDAFAVLRGAAAGAGAGSSGGVRERPGLPPLYLQYHGHAVTVVGIERRPRPAAPAFPGANASPSSSSSSAWWGGAFWRAHDYALLVFDPSVPTARLEGALATGAPSEWGPLVRRLATGQLLSRMGPNAQYQIVRVDRAVRRAGPMRGGELEVAKVPTAFEWFTT